MRGVALALLVGCYHPTAATNVPCASNGDCPGSQICDTDLPQPVCVDTLPDASHADSSGAPVGAACSRDSDCASTVCGETKGMCIDDATSLFVSLAGNDANDCSRASPCKTLSTAAGKVDASHTTIKVAMGSYTDSVLLTGGVDLLISGEQLGETGTDITFDAANGRDYVVEARTTNLTIEGMAFHGGKTDTLRSQTATLELHHVGVYASMAGGIDCTGCTLAAIDAHVTGHTGIAIDARTGAAISVHRTRVSGKGGGIRVTNASYDVSSCFLVGNGGQNALAAFVNANTDVTVPARFAFNTVADNASGGVSCGIPMTVSSSVFSDNGGPVTAMCSASYSVFRFSSIPGMGNKMADPMFVDQANGDYHIKAGSPAIDMGDPNETETTDVDDDMRPGGAKNDVGADEVP